MGAQGTATATAAPAAAQLAGVSPLAKAQLPGQARFNPGSADTIGTLHHTLGLAGNRTQQNLTVFSSLMA